MTKKELIEMLSPVSDDAEIKITNERYDLIGSNIYAMNINGYYEHNGFYVLSSHNIRPYFKESND